jgi:acetyl esterase/lipase
MSIEKDVVVASPGGRDLHVDIYRPAEGAVPTRAAILLVHGGGWAVGNRDAMAAMAASFAAKGFLALAIEYRLVGEAPWPAQLDDVKAAARWTADNADRLGIDPGRIVLAGCSAGGQLAMLTAAELRQEPRIAAVVALFPASELSVAAEPEKGELNAVALLGPNASAEAVRSASPLHQITADYPPVFLLHGGGDWLIDPVASLRVYEKLRSLGVPAELHIYARGLHEFSAEPGMVEPVTSETAVFLSRVLLEPERWDAEALESNLFAKGPEFLKALMASMHHDH